MRSLSQNQLSFDRQWGEISVQVISMNFKETGLGVGQMILLCSISRLFSYLYWSKFKPMLFSPNPDWSNADKTAIWLMDFRFHAHLRCYEERRYQCKDIVEKFDELKFFLRHTMRCVLALQSIIHVQLKIRVLSYGHYPFT